MLRWLYMYQTEEGLGKSPFWEGERGSVIMALLPGDNSDGFLLLDVSRLWGVIEVFWVLPLEVS